MNGRQRVAGTIERTPIDRIPRFDSFWEDTLTEWREQGMPADVDSDDYFGWDIRMLHVDASMRREQKLLESDGEFLVFQDRAGYTVRKMAGKSRALEWLDHVTKDKEAWQAVKDGFVFDPADTARVDVKSYFAHMDPYPTWVEAKALFDSLQATGNYVLLTVYGPWEGTWRHRGYTELMMDLVMEPDWIIEMASAQSDLVQAILRHCIELDIKPDGVYLVDDLACTRGLLFSPDTWREIFKPLYRQLGSFLKDNGMTFWLHCCGNCEALIDDFIECGLDVLQPLQAHAGMDVRDLKARYGDALTLWGNIDVTKMSGPADACEAEIRDKITAAKQGGGYIYHSDHSVPPEVSFERYQWIMDLVHQHGRY